MGRAVLSRDLRALLERYLPLYMVPSHFMELETLPINQQTGKLERKALPAYYGKRDLRSSSSTPGFPSTLPRVSVTGPCGSYGAKHWMSTATHWKMTGTSLILAATP